MSWRVVVITGRCKLEYRLGYLVCRGEETKKIFMDEIDTLVVESTAVSITAALLCELTRNKINLVFCDEKHNPHSQLNALYGRHDCSGMLRAQLNWTQEAKERVWAEIIRRKIKQQYLFLQELESPQATLLEGYLEEVSNGDISNREGHAAKVYFNALFGLKFRRGDNGFINGALNYGYAIILSAFNRQIVGEGYDTRLGIAHKNEFNYYNLSCDLMEPFRAVVDRFVFNSEEPITTEYKRSMVNLLNREVKINGKRCTLLSAIGQYCKSVFCALETGEATDIVSYEL